MLGVLLFLFPREVEAFLQGYLFSCLAATMARFLAAAALLAAPAGAYVAPTPGTSSLDRLSRTGAASEAPEFVVFDTEPAAESASPFSVAAAAFGIGAVLGWLNSRKQEVAAVAVAAAVAMTPMAANAMVDYDGEQYLGGSDKVDINNANIQAYRQFPGMYPTVAGLICTHGPYKTVQDLYNVPGMTDQLKGILKKYEGNLLVLPANEAYFIDRINNAMYR